MDYGKTRNQSFCSWNFCISDETVEVVQLGNPELSPVQLIIEHSCTLHSHSLSTFERHFCALLCTRYHREVKDR
jgi:hypothetical protein